MLVQLYKESPLLALLRQDCMDTLKALCLAPQRRRGVFMPDARIEHLGELADMGFIAYDERTGQVKEVTPAGRAAVRLLP